MYAGADVPRWLGFALRVVGTAGGIAWISTQVDLDEATHALARIPALTLAVAVVLVASNVVSGALRWRLVLQAFGAGRIPASWRLVRLNFIAFFYNNYLPGAVAGDVGRGIATREAFDDKGATGSLAVVLVERLLGLFGLFALLALGLILAADRIEAGTLWWWTVIGSLGVCLLIAAIPVARRAARVLPGPLRRVAVKLPVLRDGRAFVAAIVVSIVTQGLVAVAGWQLLAAFGPLSLVDALLVVPLASAAMFLPITIGGVGVREAAYVALCSRLFGMAEADALAASLALWFSNLAVGAMGGLLQLVRVGPRATDGGG